MAEIGAPVRRVEARFVHGFMYTRVWPLIGGDKPAKQAAARCRSSSSWRACTPSSGDAPSRPPSRCATDRRSTSRSDGTPRSARGCAPSNQSVPGRRPGTTLDDAALQQHIGDLLDHLREHYELHFWLHGHDLGPIARYLYEAIGWGLDPRGGDRGAGRRLAVDRPSRSSMLCRLRTLVDDSGSRSTRSTTSESISDEAGATARRVPRRARPDPRERLRHHVVHARRAARRRARQHPVGDARPRSTTSSDRRTPCASSVPSEHRADVRPGPRRCPRRDGHARRQRTADRRVADRAAAPRPAGGRRPARRTWRCSSTPSTHSS